MKRFDIHPVDPQPRLISQLAQRLAAGELVAMPTDASHVLCCALDNKAAVDRLRQVRGLDDRHLLTLMCADLTELAQYARVDNAQFRFLKEWTPGAYTFILPATREVPRRLWHPSRKTVGLRVPDSATVQALLKELGAPVIATSLVPAGEEEPLTDPDQIQERFGRQVDVLVVGEPGGILPTTVVDLGEDGPQVLRVGRGPVDRMLG